MQIEPYECENIKTEIPQLSILPEPKLAQPIQSNQTLGITLARLGMIALFTILFLRGLR
jgi:hypothetical protein